MLLFFFMIFKILDYAAWASGCSKFMELYKELNSGIWSLAIYSVKFMYGAVNFGGQVIWIVAKLFTMLT